MSLAASLVITSLLHHFHITSNSPSCNPPPPQLYIIQVTTSKPQSYLHHHHHHQLDFRGSFPNSYHCWDLILLWWVIRVELPNSISEIWISVNHVPSNDLSLLKCLSLGNQTFSLFWNEFFFLTFFFLILLYCILFLSPMSSTLVTSCFKALYK